MSALTPGRAIQIDTVTGGLDMPVDAYKAIIGIVEGIEARIAGGETVATILVGAKIPVTGVGKNPFNIHVFDMYGDFGAGDYAFEYVETVPNHANIS
jgi:hypothetical protein